MRPTILTALCVLSLTSCGALGLSDPASVVISVAKQALTPYSFHFTGEAKGELAVNARYAAVDAEVDIMVTYRAPVVLGGPSVVVWARKIERSSGQRAYRVDFGNRESTTGEDQDFVRIVPVSWAEARISMPWLSEPKGEPVPAGEVAEVPVVLPEGD